MAEEKDVWFPGVDWNHFTQAGAHISACGGIGVDLTEVTVRVGHGIVAYLCSSYNSGCTIANASTNQCGAVTGEPIIPTAGYVKQY